MDKILEQFGLKYEDLSIDEKETLNSWQSALEQNKISVQTIKEHIHAMKDSVERELTKSDNNTHQDLFLKARLRNYLLLEAFLESPEKAKKAIENQLKGIANK